jgi:hypothetical protein
MRPVEHPGWDFKPPICLRPIKRAAEDDKTILVDGTMNANSVTKPGMMPIKNFAKNCIVGVLKPRCITRLARTFQSTRTRRRREQYMPLVAFCLRHFLGDFIICMCEFDFRQAQLKLGFEIAQSSVAKYMVKRRAPPSRLNVAVQENGRSPRYDVRRRRSPSSRADRNF